MSSAKHVGTKPLYGEDVEPDMSDTALTSHVEMWPCMAAAAVGSEHHAMSAFFRLDLSEKAAPGTYGGRGGDRGGGGGDGVKHTALPHE